MYRHGKENQKMTSTSGIEAQSGDVADASMATGSCSRGASSASRVPKTMPPAIASRHRQVKVIPSLKR